MKNAPVFVDTNVLIYAHDKHAGQKRKVAAKVLESLWDSRRGIISAQVLTELHAVLFRKFGLPLEDVAALGRAYKIWCAVDTTPALIEQGVELMKRYRLAFFDSLIVAAVIACGAQVLLSEDFNTGQTYNGIRAINPFEVGFSMEALKPLSSP